MTLPTSKTEKMINETVVEKVIEKAVENSISPAPLQKKSPMSSIFNQANKDKFAKKPEPSVPVHASPAEATEKPVDKKKKQMKNKHAEDENTLFVGNLPGMYYFVILMIVVDIINKPATLKKAFSAFGSIKTLRFRSISVDSTPISSFNKKLLKKAAVIQHKLSDEKKSVNAYIVYESKDSVAKALSLNNTVLLERHIVVDTVGKKDHTNKDANSRTLFVGGLPFKCDEEELRQFFESKMQDQKSRNGLENADSLVQSVRLIRAKDTQKGKGIGYVVLKVRYYYDDNNNNMVYTLE